jgi:hypothetical protein
MRSRAVEPEVRRERVEGERRQLAAGDERPREARGVEAVVVDARQREPRSTVAGLEEGPVEADVVAGDERSFEQRCDGEQRLPQERRVRPRGLREPADGERLGLRVVEPLGGDERVALASDLEGARIHAQHRDLDDLVSGGIEARGLEVDEGDAP